jgi:polyisoprenoid-binding protein YceI
MSRSARTIVGIVIGLIVILLVVVAYLWVSGGSAAPSATLSAPTLAIAAQASPTAQTAATAEVTTTAATNEATAEATVAADASASQSGVVVFNIVQDQSKVSFTLGEDLFGKPNTVVGTTNQVAGQIAVDFNQPASSQIGEIRIDARSLATDSSMRDRMIRGQILQSSQNQYEFVSFKPTTITGLPAAVTLGTAFDFQVTGDLTIRNITKSVTFDATVTPESQTQISGMAKATVTRDDFGLTIPVVPSATNVMQEVQLQIDFVAATS